MKCVLYLPSEFIARQIVSKYRGLLKVHAEGTPSTFKVLEKRALDIYLWSWMRETLSRSPCHEGSGGCRTSALSGSCLPEQVLPLGIFKVDLCFATNGEGFEFSALNNDRGSPGVCSPYLNFSSHFLFVCLFLFSTTESSL